MDEVFHDLDWILPLRSDSATVLFEFFTALGYFPFYLALLPLGYWLWNKNLFTRLAVLIMLSAVLNAFLKDLFEDPRPAARFALDGRVGDSFGLPSGHAQIAAVTWFWLAFELKRRWAWMLAGVLVAGISFSRLYLGVHDLQDVLAGLGLGLASVLLFGWLLPPRFRLWHALDGRIQLGLILAAQTVLWLLWPEPDGPGRIVAVGAFLTGWWAGVLLDRRTQGFRRHPSWLRAVTAALLGLAVLFGVLTGLATPLQALGLSATGAIWLQTGLMGLFVTLIAPWLFRQARLAQ